MNKVVLIVLGLLFFYATLQPTQAQQVNPAPVNQTAGGTALNAVTFKEVEQQVAADPQNWILHNVLGVMYARRQAYDKSLDALKRASELAPDNAMVYRNLSIVYDSLDRFDDAMLAIQRSLAIEPDDPLGNRELCELNMLKHRFTRAVDCYEKLERIVPLDHIGYVRYSYSLAYAGQLKKAETVSDEALRLFADKPEVYNNAGILCFMTRDFKGAVGNFNKAIELRPDFSPAQFNLAVANLYNGKRSEAISQYGQMKYSNPQLADELYKVLYRNALVSARDMRPGIR